MDAPWPNFVHTLTYMDIHQTMKYEILSYAKYVFCSMFTFDRFQSGVI